MRRSKVGVNPSTSASEDGDGTCVYVRSRYRWQVLGRLRPSSGWRGTDSLRCRCQLSFWPAVRRIWSRRGWRPVWSASSPSHVWRAPSSASRFLHLEPGARTTCDRWKLISTPLKRYLKYYVCQHIKWALVQNITQQIIGEIKRLTLTKIMLCNVRYTRILWFFIEYCYRQKSEIHDLTFHLD